MQIVVPMAGLGSRFRDAGYQTPKPLIPVFGKPMVVRVVEHLPPAERTIFIVNRHHVEMFQVDEVLRHWFPRSHVVIAPDLTEGQACTVRLAAPALDRHREVLVAACDAAHIYDAAKFNNLRDNPHIDAAIWTYRGEQRVLASPESYGWAQVAEDNHDDQTVLRVSCKQPLHAAPECLNDHVVSGFFWFRSAHQMLKAIDATIEGNDRVRGEFYMDVVMNRLVEQGRRVVVFEVDKHISWGTPSDLEEHHRRSGNDSPAAGPPRMKTPTNRDQKNAWAP